MQSLTREDIVRLLKSEISFPGKMYTQLYEPNIRLFASVLFVSLYSLLLQFHPTLANIWYFIITLVLTKYN